MPVARSIADAAIAPPTGTSGRTPTVPRVGTIARMLTLLLLATCAADAPQATTDGTPDAAPPNVVVIWSDDLTLTGLGCYGAAPAHTPNLDRLAARSLVFDAAYCAYPVCGPTRAAAMAGMDAEALGIMGNGASARIDAALGDRPSMSQAIAAAGHARLRSGKIYHMRVPGDITAGVAPMDHAASWEETFNAHAPEWMTEGEAENISNTRITMDPEGHYDLGFGGAFYAVKGSSDGHEQADHQIATAALDMLDRHADGPFYLAVGFVRPHVPLVAPASLFEALPAESFTPPEVPAGDQDDIPKRLRGRSFAALRDSQTGRKQRVLQGYAAAIAFLDQQVGRVLDDLDARDLTDRTIVVFLSDHGYHLGEHDFWQKMSLHDESARIPMMIAGPGIRPGRTAALVQQIDLYPTLCELVGVDVPPHVQGRSLVPLLREDVARDEPAAIHDAVSTVSSNGRLLRTPQHAYLVGRDGERAIYDMAADPQQHTNLAGTAAGDAVQPQLEAAMTQLLTERGITSTPKQRRGRGRKAAASR